MNETEEPRVTPEPTFWEETQTEPFPDQATYWCCFGTCRQPEKHKWWKPKQENKSASEKLDWIVAHYSKEDAEASAVSHVGRLWVWNRMAAEPITLTAAMWAARKDAMEGVLVATFINGVETIVKTYLASQPLPEHLR